MNIQGVTDTINISGFEKIEIVEAKAVSSISFPDEDWQVEVLLKSGYSWNTIYFTPGTESLKVSQKTDESGYYFICALNIVNPKITGEKVPQFSFFQEKDLVIVGTSANGSKILIGSPDNPARVSYNIDISQVSGGKNQRKITFETYYDNEPYFVKAQETLILGGFSDGFSTGFDI